MTPADSRERLINEAASLLVSAFQDYNASFGDYTRRAKRRFEQRDRAGMRHDVSQRFVLYDQSIEEAIARLEGRLAERLFSRPLWSAIRDRYAECIEQELDAELYKTFFNTIARRLFKTRGVDADIEFVALDIQPSDQITQPVPRYTFMVAGSLVDTFSQILDAYSFSLPYASPSAQAHALAERLQAAFGQDQAVVCIELLETVFYREGRAYLVGRALARDQHRPCVIALVCDDETQTIRADALLCERQQLSILFGFTFSYFMADLPTVADAVLFLRSLLPDKPIDELYTVLGRIKQGKTERYRAFFHHLSQHDGMTLAEAPGQRGLVMVVFTLPNYPLVFKVIRDHFAPSKQFGRAHVRERYNVVFRHDRVGRLVDAQEFKDLRFPVGALSEALLAELHSSCGKSLMMEDDSLTIKHCYVERRLRPLDLYLAEVEPSVATAAALDYGQALKDLARSNIFAGDLLPKNFGVTRSGRVIFYDYDELRLMSECRFRRWPDAGDDLLDLSHEPWFHVGEADVFPEQFHQFMGLPPACLAALQAQHAELFLPEWWQTVQAQLARGETLDVPPYGSAARLS